MKYAVNESTRKPVEPKSPELDDKIRRRAYELYEQRGRTDGSELEDWVRAEIEVLGPNDITRAA
jgi:Protein of unknown function (DUF2934)